MQEALGLNDDQLIVKWNIPEDETAKDAAMDLADQGARSYLQTALVMSLM